MVLPLSEYLNQYVVGFLFRQALGVTEVALIEKQKPAWQAGLLNGIGGKIEVGESPIVAMRREFKEEAGAEIKEWKHFVTLNQPYVAFFTSRTPAKIETMETEKIDWYAVDDIPFLETVPNLRWLIPLALMDEPFHGYITC